MFSYLDSSFVLLLTKGLNICVNHFCSMHFYPMHIFQMKIFSKSESCKLVGFCSVGHNCYKDVYFKQLFYATRYKHRSIFSKHYSLKISKQRLCFNFVCVCTDHTHFQNDEIPYLIIFSAGFHSFLGQ